MGDKTTRRPLRLVAALLGLGALSACGGGPGPAELDAMFERGESLCLDGRFEEAKRVLKAYLIYRPGDAGGHYYLGRTYMLSDDFRPIMAEGEYQTALRLFHRGGRESPIDRFGDEYFEMICYVDSAKVLYLQGMVVLSIGAPPPALEGPLGQALAYLDRAEAAFPEAQEVAQVRASIRNLANRVGVRLPNAADRASASRA